MFKIKEVEEFKEENIDKNAKLVDNRQFEEKRVYGMMTWKAYFNYFRMGGGIFGTILIVFIFIISEFLLVLMDYWVSQW